VLKRFLLVKLVLVGVFLSCSTIAAQINGVRFWQDPEKTRIVFDVSDDVEYKIFTLSNPSRLVVDVKKSALKANLSEIEVPKSLVSQIRSSLKDNNTRVVIDLKKTITIKHFKLKPYQKYGHRLVVDLKPEDSLKKVTKTAESHQTNENRDIVITIDAGHGGEDPGAPGGEKGVTLAAAKKLAKLINNEKGMRAVLTRKGDYFVDLLKRTEIARKNKADLFISLHADGFSDKRVRGASVWVLSPKGASSEMGRWLEQKEKASDMAGGVDISRQDPMVAQVLLDLSMNYSVGESIEASELVRKQLTRNKFKMHGKTIKKAAFVVLKMPDIPAMLVEMGFISNKTENKLLKSKAFQQKIANSVLLGVKAYFRANPPDGTLYAKLIKSGRQSELTGKNNTKVAQKTKQSGRKKNSRKAGSYKVRSGDTLSEIALQHGVTTSKLKSHNRLKTDRLRVGQVIKIPAV
jgi:N-acetylmuramoyl-L-alanine amidase